MITIGRILKPQGVRGEVKVKSLTVSPSRFCVVKSVHACGKEFRIEKVRVSGDYAYIKLVGVDDRNGAEKLRDAFIEIDDADSLVLSDGEFFVSELIGAALVAVNPDGEKTVGVIRSVESFGAADVFTVDCADGKEMTFAFVKALSPVLDETGRTLRVDGNILAEVAVFDED